MPRVGFSYRESPPWNELRDSVACVWRRTGTDQPVRVLPDACMDLMWIGGALRVAGPDTTAQLNELPRGAPIVGVRFRPGAAAAVLGVPADALVGARVDAGDIWDAATGSLAARLADTESAGEAADLLQQMVAERLRDAPPPDRAVQGVVAAVHRARGGKLPHRAVLAEELGRSDRQLRRRCHAALGYGPAVLARILRFQRFLAFAERADRPGSDGLALLAASAGYADQAHLSRESVRLSGLAPAALLAERAAPARGGGRDVHSVQDDSGAGSAGLTLWHHPQTSPTSKPPTGSSGARPG